MFKVLILTIQPHSFPIAYYFKIIFLHFTKIARLSARLIALKQSRFSVAECGGYGNIPLVFTAGRVSHDMALKFEIF